MNDHHHSNGPGFINGLIVGMLIGAGLVFFLGTKRGKELVDELKEEGSSFLDDFIELFDEVEEDAQPMLQAETLAQEPVSTPTPVEATPLQLTQPVPEQEMKDDSPSPTPLYVSTLQQKGRRLFHGIPKRR